MSNAPHISIYLAVTFRTEQALSLISVNVGVFCSAVSCTGWLPCKCMCSDNAAVAAAIAIG